MVFSWVSARGFVTKLVAKTVHGFPKKLDILYHSYFNPNLTPSLPLHIRDDHVP